MDYLPNWQTGVSAYLLRTSTAPQFDLIYVAPPQYQELWIKTLRLLDQRPSTYLTAGGIVVVQIDPKEKKQLDLVNLTLYDERKYGNTWLGFYEQV